MYIISLVVPSICVSVTFSSVQNKPISAAYNVIGQQINIKYDSYQIMIVSVALLVF